MEIAIALLGVLLLKALVEFIRWLSNSGDVDVPNINGLSCEQVFKLADKYCYGDGVKRSSKVAKHLIDHVIEHGTKAEIKKALEYKKNYC